MKEKLSKDKWVVLVMAVLAGLVLMSLGTLVKSQNVPMKQQSEGGGDTLSSQPVTVSSDIAKMEQVMEQRLEGILAEIEGAGQVSVSLFLAAGPEYNYAVNMDTSQRTIEEQDQQGGARVTTEVTEQSQMVMADRSAGAKPVVVKESKPEVQGVLVVADGAVNPYLKAMLNRAVQTLMGIPAHQVTVLPRK